MLQLLRCDNKECVECRFSPFRQRQSQTLDAGGESYGLSRGIVSSRCASLATIRQLKFGTPAASLQISARIG